MYVRIARFEGGDDNWEERVEEVRKRIRGGGEDSPMAAARGTVKRAMMLVDRENRRGASVTFCDSEEDLRRVDEMMNQMTPPGGTGGATRVGVEMYEVVIDEQPA